MKLNFILVSILLVLISTSLSSQVIKQTPTLPGGKSVGTKSEIQYMPCDGISNPPSLDLSLRPVIAYQKKKTIRHRGPDQDLIDSLKKVNQQLKLAGSSTFTNNPNEKEDDQNSLTPLKPEVGDRWDTNPFTGSVPPDNTIAIGNTGWVITGANSSICYSRNGAVTYTQTLEALLNYPGWDGYCDPVVLFDPIQRRFFLYVQQCDNTQNNKVALLFSKTSNPNDGWYRYILKGDQTNLGRFFDYPKIAVTNNEVFLTANVFGSDSKFADSQLWQINKSSGYNGQTLQFVYWSNFNDDINFTLLPVSFGLNNTYGPGVYLVATESAKGDKIALYDLTDELSKNPELIYYEITVPSYEVGSDAFQKGTSCNLDVGDCRALSGFYLNGFVHFVNAAKLSNGWNGIHYYRVNVENRTATKGTFGLEDYDYAYPAIASYATATTGKSAMIVFTRSAADDYPESRVVHVDDNLEWSSSTYVKGLWEVDCFSGNETQRWGDYLGICRNYSTTAPSVMVAGPHGSFDGEWESHAAEVHDSGPVSNKDLSGGAQIKVWPNPVQKRISFNFQAPQTALVKVICTSEDGTTTKELLNSTAQSGENTFSMNTEGLVSGVYILSIVQNQQIIANEKIVVQH